jgi:hypothetical protein
MLPLVAKTIRSQKKMLTRVIVPDIQETLDTLRDAIKKMTKEN